MTRLPLKTILIQLFKDLVGKDVYRGTTQTYTLLANQFGHFALGFIPATFIYMSCHCARPAGNGPWLWVGISWTVFEILNYLYSIIRFWKKVNKLGGLGKFPFKPSSKGLIFDTIADMGFFWLGAICAGTIFFPSPSLKCLFAALLIVFTCIFFYWYIVKIYVQEALFPFHYRLSQWVNRISTENAAKALAFRDEKKGVKHLLIFGHTIPEKTSLSIGIATEMAFNRKSCLYITALKLFPMLGEKISDSNHSLDIRSVWTWRDISVLVVDDIDLSHSGKDEVHTATEFYNKIDHEIYAEKNKAALCSKNVIWILGDDNDCSHNEKQWREELLLKMGVAPENITCIHLKKDTDN